MAIGQRALVAGVLTLVVTVTPVGLAQIGPKFYDDDPLLREPETQDASNVQAWDNILSYDLIQNLFATPGDTRRTAVGAGLSRATGLRTTPGPRVAAEGAVVVRGRPASVLFFAAAGRAGVTFDRLPATVVFGRAVVAGLPADAVFAAGRALAGALAVFFFFFTAPAVALPAARLPLVVRVRAAPVALVPPTAARKRAASAVSSMLRPDFAVTPSFRSLTSVSDNLRFSSLAISPTRIFAI